MKWYQFAATMCVSAGLLKGAVIDSGTIAFSETLTSAGNSANIQISDGIHYDVGHSSDGPLLGQCPDYGSGCIIGGLPNLALGSTSGFVDAYDGFLSFTYGGTFTPVNGVVTQQFQTTFATSGEVGFFISLNSTANCPFPEAPSRLDCNVGVSGSGTATFTVINLLPNGSPVIGGLLGEFYVANIVYTFASVPEPSTFLTLLIAGVSICMVQLSRRAVVCFKRFPS